MLQTDGVENGFCEFDIKTLRPTDRLLIGVPGRSNAFAISERLGLGKEIVDRARGLVSESNVRFENVVDILEASRQGLENEMEEVRLQKAAVADALKEAERVKDEARASREKEIEDARSQAIKITEKARREANMLIMELEKIKKERDKARDAAELAKRARATIRKGLESIESASDPVINLPDDGEEYTLPRPLVSGDSVIIASLSKEAKVQSPPDKNNNVEVMVGTAKMRVRLEELRLITESRNEKADVKGRRRASSGFGSVLNADVRTKLDLRGMTVDDCLIELDMFIDLSLRTGIGEFAVIHGKGTGALKNAVTQYLKRSPYIKSHRLGVFGEGEDGVTIVELK